MQRDQGRRSASGAVSSGSELAVLALIPAITKSTVVHYLPSTPRRHLNPQRPGEPRRCDCVPKIYMSRCSLPSGKRALWHGMVTIVSAILIPRSGLHHGARRPQGKSLAAFFAAAMRNRSHAIVRRCSYQRKAEFLQIRMVRASDGGVDAPDSCDAAPSNCRTGGGVGGAKQKGTMA